MVAPFAVRPGVVPGHQASPPAGGRDRGGARAGFAYLRGQPVLLLALALSFVLGSLGRNYQVTMAAMSDGPLEAGASGYGFLSTVFAVGTVLGALVAARRSSLGYRTLVAAGLLASGLQIVADLAPGTWSFAAVILPIAAAAVVIDTTVGTRAQLDTDGVMRGRVLAALAVTGSVSAAVGPSAARLARRTRRATADTRPRRFRCGDRHSGGGGRPGPPTRSRGHPRAGRAAAATSGTASGVPGRPHRPAHRGRLCRRARRARWGPVGLGPARGVDHGRAGTAPLRQRSPPGGRSAGPIDTKIIVTLRSWTSRSGYGGPAGGCGSC